ncbi:hypothetical protein [Flammeovirga kamogawensis]|uniref:Lipoprotein n=1 Tax=Flammeovirga kamogawensis TaxID=373891 RepID=A0ABX8H4K1_9BACT|nr:hypothetical protein [Flammeovirga kamogawensis]MBB6460461.1 hypothetical protein [Flammeovirga kamogawensis]QWG10267.1 hypothetical protein KM029_21530 [Flammeovirga kamogawensis]TRX64715.1 hypothetical protein EO216_19450 [Flammeovirga kamogawensis]
MKNYNFIACLLLFFSSCAKEEIVVETVEFMEMNFADSVNLFFSTSPNVSETEKANYRMDMEGFYSSAAGSQKYKGHIFRDGKFETESMRMGIGFESDVRSQKIDQERFYCIADFLDEIFTTGDHILCQTEYLQWDDEVFLCNNTVGYLPSYRVSYYDKQKDIVYRSGLKIHHPEAYFRIDKITEIYHAPEEENRINSQGFLLEGSYSLMLYNKKSVGYQKYSYDSVWVSDSKFKIKFLGQACSEHLQ